MAHFCSAEGWRKCEGYCHEVLCCWQSRVNWPGLLTRIKVFWSFGRGIHRERRVSDGLWWTYLSKPWLEPHLSYELVHLRRWWMWKRRYNGSKVRTLHLLWCFRTSFLPKTAENDLVIGWERNSSVVGFRSCLLVGFYKIERVINSDKFESTRWYYFGFYSEPTRTDISMTRIFRNYLSYYIVQKSVFLVPFALFSSFDRNNHSFLLTFTNFSLWLIPKLWLCSFYLWTCRLLYIYIYIYLFAMVFGNSWLF